MHLNDAILIRPPEHYTLGPEEIRLNTQPHTDLWQRTYYNFRNDSAPLFLWTTARQYFSFSVRTMYEGARQRFDQCGIAVYLDGENWLKAAVEYENSDFAHLGTVVTNGGYSDWATTRISAQIRSMWYRLSRRQADFRVESSEDGQHFTQLRICHLSQADGEISFGVYGCSPENSSFEAVFSKFSLTDCQWPAHDGQPPDPQ